MLPFVVRPSTERDLIPIAGIYSHYVLHSSATFEITPPTPDELAKRRSQILDLGLPYLVAEQSGTVIGYAYASEYRSRPAYRFTVEDSLYVDPCHVGRGCGIALLSALIQQCEAGPWWQMIAVIANTDSRASIRLHERFAFSNAGTLRSVGFKFNNWLDTVLMQRVLGAGDGAPPIVFQNENAQP